MLKKRMTMMAIRIANYPSVLIYPVEFIRGFTTLGYEVCVITRENVTDRSRLV
jgi:hypothetical protein